MLNNMNIDNDFSDIMHIFLESDKIMYQESFEEYHGTKIKFVLVPYEAEGCLWKATREQIKGHENHYINPRPNQYLPYNVVYSEVLDLFGKYKELPRPRVLKTGTNDLRTNATTFF